MQETTDKLSLKPSHRHQLGGSAEASEGAAGKSWNSTNVSGRVALLELTTRRMHEAAYFGLLMTR